MCLSEIFIAEKPGILATKVEFFRETRGLNDQAFL